MFIADRYSRAARLLFNRLSTMEVFVNRKPVAVESGTSLAELLDRLGIAPDGTAAAVDNKVVPRDMWRQTIPAEGAKITVIRAVCGG